MTYPDDGSVLPEVAFCFKSLGDPTTLWRVIRLSLREAMSETYECVIDLATETLTAAPSAMLKQRAVLEMERDVVMRRVHGVVRRVEDLGTVAGNRLVRVFVVPRLWLLSQRIDSRIFQRLTALEIVIQVLAAAGLYVGEVTDRVDADRPVREFCVQYQESDLDFVMRLLEEEGVTFFFDHQEDKEVLVLDDNPSSMLPVLGLGGDVFSIAGTEASTASQETIRRFDWHHEALSSGVTLCDYDFTNPGGVMDLTRPFPAPPMGTGVFEYPARYTWSTYDDDSRHAWQRHDGQKRGDRRQKEIETWTESGEGLGNGVGFTPGFTFGLVDHGREDLNRRYVITRIEHRALVREELTTDHRDPSLGDDRYHNRFECVADTVPFRPRRVTPRPVIHGVQTAVVVGDQPEIDTEFHGRVKVQFHWDRSGRTGREASCWIRVAQTWAGAGWGTMFIPRLGMEVVVAFEEGDPDRPLIVGCVYNGANNTPYPLDNDHVAENKTKSTLKSNSSLTTGGYNELRFEDRAGSEQVYLQAEKNLDELVKHNHSTTVHANQRNSVGGNQGESVGGNQTMKVEGDRAKTINGKEDNTVNNGRVTTITPSDALQVCGTQEIDITGNQSFRCMSTQTYAVTVDRNTTVDVNDTLTVGTMLLMQQACTDIILRGDTCTIQSPVKITLVVGDSSITIEPSMITITSATVKIAGGNATIDLTNGLAVMTNSESGVELNGSAATFAAGEGATVSGATVNVTATGDVAIDGATVKLNG